MAEVWFYTTVDDQQFGPCTIKQMRLEWNAGRVDQNCQAWCDGLDDWQCIRDIEELLTAMAQPGPASPKLASKQPSPPVSPVANAAAVPGPASPQPDRPRSGKAVLEAMVASEERYQDGTLRAYHMYIRRVMAHEQQGRPLLPAAERATLFSESVVTTIVDLSAPFLRVLEALSWRPSEQIAREIASLLQTHAAVFTAYQSFIQAASVHRLALEGARAKHKKFRDFCEQEEQANCAKLGDLLTAIMTRCAQSRSYLQAMVDAFQDELSPGDRESIAAQIREISAFLKFG